MLTTQTTFPSWVSAAVSAQLSLQIRRRTNRWGDKNYEKIQCSTLVCP